VAELRYPIVREWMTKRLVRPIEVWFQINEMTGTCGRVVAKIGQYRFPADEPAR
jgi:hypothetical protein